MATHSSTLAWKIPWTEEPGRLQSMGSWRVRHDWATSLLLFTFMPWRRKWQPTPVLAWKIPGTAEPGGLLSLRSHRVRHDWRDLAAAAAAVGSTVCCVDIFENCLGIFLSFWKSFRLSGQVLSKKVTARNWILITFYLNSAIFVY